METVLGRGYSVNDESALTDFYSPPSSVVDEDEDIFYPEDEEEIEQLPTINIEESNLEDDIEPSPVKLMSIETTPPSTPLLQRRLIEPINNPIVDFQNLQINSNLSPMNWSTNPKTPTTNNLLTPTSIDRYLLEHHRLSSTSNEHQSISVQHTQVTNEASRLYSYMNPVDHLSATATSFDDTSIYPRQVSPTYDSWFLSTILRQNQNNISLSTTAQQILNGTNRPLRSEKIDIEVIKHLIREANWKRQCGMKKEICVFCRNNGENELIYSSHSLKDPMGNVTCPILRAYQCPICGATGSQAHTIKYCQATGDDQQRHVPTPYEKMLSMQTLAFDDNYTSSIPSYLAQFNSPSSLYSNGWSDSYL